ncbi:MAG: polyprenyl synthetase family protein [Acidimicrobiales bacterium]
MNIGKVLPLPGLDAHRARVEEELRTAVAGSDAFLTEVATHLITAGGHRWRPVLTIASAMAGGADITQDVIRGACAVELVHLGSLYHDDVMDEAETRRGVVSVNARWGNLVAILAGDYLLARASEIGASLGTEVAGLLAQTIGRLCEGQVTELRDAFQTSRTEEAYFASVEGKTGALFATACRVGGICGDMPRDQVDSLTEYGAAFGVVFQIVDDIKDLVLTGEELGKPAGHDLLEGVYTLPVIRALAMPGVGDELRPLLATSIGRPEADKAIQIVRESGGIESTISTAALWADRSAASISWVRDGSAAGSLGPLADGLLGSIAP